MGFNSVFKGLNDRSSVSWQLQFWVARSALAQEGEDQSVQHRPQLEASNKQKHKSGDKSGDSMTSVCEQSVPKFICDQVQNDPLISLYKSHAQSKEHELTSHDRGISTVLSTWRCLITFQHNPHYKAHICALLYELQCTTATVHLSTPRTHRHSSLDCHSILISLTLHVTFQGPTADPICDLSRANSWPYMW